MSTSQGQDLSLRRFCIIGMVVASLEEFITQGVLRRNLIGWIIPTVIAFLPFLVATALIHRRLRKRFGMGSRIELGYYGISGAIGLMVEWFLIGLSPWNTFGADPLLAIVFQLAMFSFWGSVAFAPRIILDKRATVVGLVRWFKRSLAAGFVVIYLVTLASNRQVQFTTGIVSVMLIFLLLNTFYFQYIRSWKPSGSGYSSS